MEDITNLLKQIQLEMAEQKQQFKILEENITKNINTNINEKFQNLEIKNEQLEKKIEEQERRIDTIKREIRKKKLVFFGIQENEKNYWDLEKEVLEIINGKMNVGCTNQDISSIWRKGKKGENTRPIIVSFNSLSKKIEVIKKKKSLQQFNIYLSEDFPFKIIQKRKELREELKQLLEQGKEAYLKYDKIIIKEENNGNRRQKRLLSQSPKEDNQKNNKSNIQSHKKNKTDISTFFLSKRNPLTTQINSTPFQTQSTEAPNN